MWDDIDNMRRYPNIYCQQEPPDRTEPYGGFDQDGAPFGPHPYYDYGPRPSRLLWDYLYKHVFLPIRTRHVAVYWADLGSQRAHARRGNAPSQMDVQDYQTDF